MRIDGVEHTAHLFCMRLSYSLKSFVCVFPAARQECFFAGHVAAFAFFGGVPRRIVYDNLTSAVAKVLHGRTRIEQDSFVAFRGHYLFASHFCFPGRDGAHEKPLVESLVGYAGRNFLVPVPTAASWTELNARLAVHCRTDEARPASGRGQTIGALWREEQSALLPLQRHAYPCCRTVPVRATRQALVTFERNRYSVPTRYGGAQLLLRAFAWEVEISDGQRVVARHPRLYGRDGEHLDPLHYLTLLERKPGAFDLARPIQQWACAWPPVYRQYLEALRQARPEAATREFVRILHLHVRYTVAMLASALERALLLGCWSADGVEQLVRQALLSAEGSRGAPSGEGGHALFPEVTIPLPDLHRFDALLGEGRS